MTPSQNPTSSEERINKFLARAGIASRRGAEELISAGRVRLNGNLVVELGTKVVPGRDVVEVDGVPVRVKADRVYVVLNKPTGYVSTLKDPQGRRTVAELMPETDHRLFNVGRLDMDTTGLLLLTDDGELAHRLMHPRYHVSKEYLATVAGRPTEETLKHLRSGVELDDGMTRPAEATAERLGDTTSVVRLVIREGRKRQVRRMLRAVGHRVVALHRVRFGPIELGDMQLGTTRPLTEAEITALIANAGLEGRDD
ncbi:MAG: pseudouridine synthase [Actinobacteria bacterium HGW-Actinobacteria-1]|jgi:pseudouridine synthase|nr:MAG: pseudouridine synthase [Actinobacteria bacterium HGW-Actinobacteria-1]